MIRAHSDVQFLVLMALIFFRYVKLTHLIGPSIDQMLKQWAAVIIPHICAVLVFWFCFIRRGHPASLLSWLCPGGVWERSS